MILNLTFIHPGVKRVNADLWAVTGRVVLRSDTTALSLKLKKEKSQCENGSAHRPIEALGETMIRVLLHTSVSAHAKLMTQLSWNHLEQ